MTHEEVVEAVAQVAVDIVEALVEMGDVEPAQGRAGVLLDASKALADLGLQSLDGGAS